MYKVKLANSSDSIVVDGITITNYWKRIEKITEAMEKLENEGVIKIKKIIEIKIENGNVVCYKLNPNKDSAFDRIKSRDITNEKFKSRISSINLKYIHDIMNSPIFRVPGLFESMQNYTLTGLAKSMEESTLTGLVKSMEDSTLTGLIETTQDSNLTGLIKATQDSNLTGLIEATQDSNLTELIKATQDSNLTGLIEATQDSNLPELIKATQDSNLTGLIKATQDSNLSMLIEAIMNSPQFQTPSGQIDSIRDSMDSLLLNTTNLSGVIESIMGSSVIDLSGLSITLNESTKNYFYENLAASSFKHIELALNSMSIRENLEVALMMSHDSILNASRTFKTIIEEIHSNLLKFTDSSEAVKNAFEELQSMNEKIEREIIDFPPPFEEEEPVNKKVLTPREKDRKGDENLPPTMLEKALPLFDAINKEIDELLEPPESDQIINEYWANEEDIPEKTYKRAISDYRQKHKRLKEIFKLYIFECNTVNIERTITLKVREKSTGSISDNIPWIGSKIELKRFYNALIKGQLIQNDIEYSQFEKHFSKDSLSQIVKIRWLGIQTHLLYMFDLLIHDSLVSREIEKKESDRWKLISDHFEKNDGSPFSNTQCARAHYNMVNTNKGQKPKKSKGIEKIIRFVKASGNPVALPVSKPDGLHPSKIPRFH